MYSVHNKLRCILKFVLMLQGENLSVMAMFILLFACGISRNSQCLSRAVHTNLSTYLYLPTGRQTHTYINTHAYRERERHTHTPHTQILHAHTRFQNVHMHAHMYGHQHQLIKTDHVVVCLKSTVTSSM